jgi:hypothetical protein
LLFFFLHGTMGYGYFGLGFVATVLMAPDTEDDPQSCGMILIVVLSPAPGGIVQRLKAAALLNQRAHAVDPSWCRSRMQQKVGGRRGSTRYLHNTEDHRFANLQNLERPGQSTSYQPECLLMSPLPGFHVSAAVARLNWLVVYQQASGAPRARVYIRCIGSDAQIDTHASARTH